ncbi:MAG: hypothetical protein EBW88_00535, partial [Betaproteobacteria bacterium]|nr:hypothetical protein [Betaproteobacteria bacterium]
MYTDRIKTPKGERVRVRVGPFANKADAVKVQTKLRQAQIVERIEETAVLDLLPVPVAPAAMPSPLPQPPTRTEISGVTTRVDGMPHRVLRTGLVEKLESGSRARGFTA